MTERLPIQGSMDSANIQKTWWLYKLYIGDYITHLAPRGLTSLPWWLLFCCFCWWKLQGGCAYGIWCDGCGVNTDKFRSKFKQGNPKTVTIMTRAFADTSEGPHLPKGFQARVRDKGRIRTRWLQAHSPKPIRSWCRLWIRGVVRNLLPRENLKKFSCIKSKASLLCSQVGAVLQETLKLWMTSIVSCYSSLKCDSWVHDCPFCTMSGVVGTQMQYTDTGKTGNGLHCDNSAGN